jgi:hypothetical protein
MAKTHRSLFQLDTLMAIGLALFLLLLPFHLVIKKLLPDPLGTYWKEVLLGFLMVLWAIRCVQRRRLLLSDTALDWAVLLYLGLLLLRFVLDGAGWVSAWGLYVSVLYLPLFWLVPTTLRGHPRWVTWLVALLIIVGAIVALGALAEFVLDVPLWPSDEIKQRLGSSDFYIYGTHVRRVYFTFDSPTTLANTLALLLPLALAVALFFPSRIDGSNTKWARLAAGLAAVLMAAALIVTFSRGIWVAVVLSLLVMGLLSTVVLRNRYGFPAAAGVLALIALAWVLVTALRPGQTDSVNRGVIEFSPSAYEAAPVTGIGAELMQMEPIHGQAATQTWTVFDPISSRDDTRRVVYEHPPESGKEEIVYSVTVPEEGALRFAIVVSPDVWSPEKGDGTSFQIYVAEPGSPENGRFVFVRYVNPKHNPSDRRWRNFLVDLSPWAGRTVHLSLITEGGPVGDWAFDWGGWSELQVVSAEPGTFSTAQTENAILRHTGSVLDWARDETNRDRLAAWSQALAAWGAAPLWGNGLGSTGVAALRTKPESAFVTESQVLKAVVELGLPGLLALAFLWFQIARVGFHAYRGAADPTRRALLFGILTGLLIIFIEGLVYQNLEVKQVNAYFWTLVGLLGYLAATQYADG